MIYDNPRKLHINHFLYKEIKEFATHFHNIGNWFPVLSPLPFFSFVFGSEINGTNTWIPSTGIKLLLLREGCHNLFVAEFVLESGQILGELVPVFWVQTLIYVRHKFVKAHGKKLPLIYRLHSEKQNEGHHYKHWHVFKYLIRWLLNA